MKKATGAIIFAAAVFIPFFAAARQSIPAKPSPSAPQTNSTSTPANPHEQEELQARVLMARKDYVGAVKAYQRLSQEEPRNATYLNFIGLALLQLSDINNAEKYFQRATKVNKRYAEAYNNLGAVEFSRKRYREAIRQYMKALAINPQVASYWGNMVYAYFAEKKYPQAMESFQKALALDPTTFETSDRNGTVMQYRAVTEHGLFDFMLAKSYAQKGDAEHCAVYLRKALEEGYKEIASARSDPAFAKVRATPEVKMVMDDLPQPPGAASASKTPPGA